MRTSALCLALTIVFVCPHASAQWVRTALDSIGIGTDSIGSVTCLAVGNATLFAGTYGRGVYRSIDNGDSWTQSGLIAGDVECLISQGVDVFAGMYYGAYYGCLFRSTNTGFAWTAVDSGWRAHCSEVSALAANTTHLFAATHHQNGLIEESHWYNLLISTNRGASWAWVDTSISGRRLVTIVATDTSLFAGSPGAGVFLSTNDGTNWRPVNTGLSDLNVRCLALIGTRLFAGTGEMSDRAGGGVFSSTNNGANWIPTRLANTRVWCFAVRGSHLFAGTDSGVALSTDMGASWTLANSGLTYNIIASLALDENYLYANAFGDGAWQGIWRRPLSEMITSVSPTMSQLPQDFLLEQNYPNPFNPSTTIRYGLPNRSHMTLTVFNTLGQQVATLVAGEQEAGFQEVQFDALGLASGVYLYRLQAGDFVQSKKFVLLK